ncbi:MAG: histidinol dehydrogenase [Woeseiaceae bacterium]
MYTDIIQWDSLPQSARSALLRRPAADPERGVVDDARAIIQRVRDGGDAALRELTRRLDGAEPALLAVSDDEYRTAEAALSSTALAAIELAIGNVRKFHAAQLPSRIDVTTMPGVRCERISQPLDSIGLYVPAGSAPLPSTAIMLCVPAALAGCPTRVLCTPPRLDGSADPAVLTAARRAGVDAIFKIGGAQAVAAMAYGTESVPKVCTIFGPGNAWVTAAKTLVAADADGAAIDMPAGPSEVLVIADEHADAVFVAADLLSQAEHGADSQVTLVTTSREFARKVAIEIEAALPRLGRRDIAREALRHCRLLHTATLDAAIDLSNAYAPEHLILQIVEPRGVLPRIRNAGSVFIGPWSPESAGDYCSGTNHVLPTYGFARSYSGLGVDQFLRHMTVQELSRDGLKALAAAIIELATLEGLDAHADAVRCRLRNAGGTGA